MTESPSLDVHYLPQFVAEADLAGGTVVVIDLLRASTTICRALASGASAVRAFLSVGDVTREAGLRDRDGVVLGGERGGEIIDGFDLGNSPAEYTPDEVFGKQVFFTTTNGTAALNHARLGSRVVVGAAVNLAAVVDAVRGDRHVHLLCAGTGGHVSRDDRLIAGAIAAGVIAEGPRREVGGPAEATAREWQELLTTARALGRTPSEQLAAELRNTPGGKNLIAIGMGDDLPRCAAIDTLDIVPELDPATGLITAP
ncbi:MAG: 2-phosphosulfolactate phosphatase [Planctomycetota bacterium]